MFGNFRGPYKKNVYAHWAQEREEHVTSELCDIRTRHRMHGGGVCACALCMRVRMCLRVHKSTYMLIMSVYACAFVCARVCVCVSVCTCDRMHACLCHCVGEDMNLRAGERVEQVVFLRDCDMLFTYIEGTQNMLREHQWGGGEVGRSQHIRMNNATSLGGGADVKPCEHSE